MAPQDDLTAGRAAKIVGIIDGLAYIDPNDHRKCEEAIRPIIQQIRQDALREAARAICPYCNDPNWPSMNQYGDHASPHTSTLFMCKAWKIHQLDRLASEGG